MKKNVFGRQFKRDTNERKALFKGLLSSLVLQEKIKTTEAKAKAIRGQADKLVTIVKRYKENSSRFLQVYLTPDAIQKLVHDVAPRFEKRNGGYTRILRLGNRFSDNAFVVSLEWVEQPPQKPEQQLPENKKEEKKPLRKKTQTKKSKETKK